MTVSTSLGQEIEWEGKSWLVVRMVESESVFENIVEGTCFIIKESYAQIQDAEGNIEFISLVANETPFQKTSAIKAMDAKVWRAEGKGAKQ